MSVKAGAGQRTLVGRLLLNGELVPGRLTVVDGRIGTLDIEGAAGGRAGDGRTGELPIIAPGLVDLHVHGFGGCDPLGDLAGMARALARAGTTAFQPTLFPREPVALGRDVEAVWNACQARGPGARAIGLHLEGPFLNPQRAGAIPEESIVLPSV